MINHSKFRVVHDQGRQLCFVGLGVMSRRIAEEFQSHNAITVSLEDLNSKNSEWFASKQFIVITSDVAFKKNVTAQIDRNNGHYFSLVHKDSEISDQTHIGVGTFVYVYTQTLPNENAFIGNHCFISSHCVIAHDVKIHDFCHLSPQCYINLCDIQEGVVVGVQAKIAGQFNHRISIAPYSNIMMNSMVTKTLEKSATYYNNRLVNRGTSLDHRIL